MIDEPQYLSPDEAKNLIAPPDAMASTENTAAYGRDDARMLARLAASQPRPIEGKSPTNTRTHGMGS